MKLTLLLQKKRIRNRILWVWQWYLGLNRRLPTAAALVEPRSGRMGFVVGKVALVQVFSEYFNFPYQFSFHRLLHIHHHLSSRADTIGQIVADVPSGLSLTLTQETKLTKLVLHEMQGFFSILATSSLSLRNLYSELRQGRSLM
jgi:hypothetical protein